VNDPEKRTYFLYFKYWNDVFNIVPAIFGIIFSFSQLVLGVFALRHPLETLQWINNFDLTYDLLEDVPTRYANWTEIAAVNWIVSMLKMIISGAIPFVCYLGGFILFYAFGEDLLRYHDTLERKVIWQIPLGYVGYFPI